MPEFFADVIHIDAAHEYESVIDDIALWWPFVGADGVLIGDDFDKTWPGVQRAAREFAAAVGLRLFVHDNKWAVKRNVRLDFDKDDVSAYPYQGRDKDLSANPHCSILEMP